MYILKRNKRTTLGVVQETLTDNGWMAATSSPIYFMNQRKASDAAYKIAEHGIYIYGPKGGIYRPRKAKK